MGKPVKCVPHNSFISYEQSVPITPTTTTIDPTAGYIIFPATNPSCPTAILTTPPPASSTTTTPAPIVISPNITNCKTYLLDINLDQVIDSENQTIYIPVSGAAIIRYQPCNTSSIVTKIVYCDRNTCIVENNFRLIAGNATFTQQGNCGP